MIFAVSMTFIDQTIVSVAAPQIQSELGLSSSGLQWGINSYLLALAAMFMLGGRLADTHGHRRMVTIGIIMFSAASALCGLTPTGPLAAGWLITFRAVQGAGGALMYPAALAIVVSAYRTEQRGRALAIFFGVAGAPHRSRPDTGRLPDRVDVAIDLLDQHPDRRHRAAPHGPRQASRRSPSRAAGPPWSCVDHLRRRAGRVRPATERTLGVG